MDDTISLSGNPIDEVIVLIEGFTRPSQSDMRLAGEIVRTGIRDRTARGVDSRGATFAPYNETTPYYYTPAGSRNRPKGRFGEPARRFSAKSDRAAVSRLLKKLNKAGTKSATGRSIKFPSYGAFKRAFGRANVDLLGVGAGDHMLDAIMVTPEDDGARIGIYDRRAATLGRAHNFGQGRMPVRAFFGIGAEDVNKIKSVLVERIRERMRNRKK